MWKLVMAILFILALAFFIVPAAAIVQALIYFNLFAADLGC